MENTSSLSKNDILNLWKGSGYINFNGFLAGDNYPFLSIKTMEYEEKIYNVESLVLKLISIMIPYGEYKRKNILKLGSEKIDYFRGEEISLFPTESYIRETFISVTSDIEDSLSFNGGSRSGCLFKISINDFVNCVETGVEKELLLEI